VVAPDGTVWVPDNRRSIVERADRTGTVLGGFDPFATTPNNDGANSLTVDRMGTSMWAAQRRQTSPFCKLRNERPGYNRTRVRPVLPWSNHR
jgi:hypothetical protein